MSAVAASPDHAVLPEAPASGRKTGRIRADPRVPTREVRGRTAGRRLVFPAGLAIPDIPLSREWPHDGNRHAAWADLRGGAAKIFLRYWPVWLSSLCAACLDVPVPRCA